MKYQEILNVLKEKFGEDIYEFGYSNKIPFEWGLGPMQEIDQIGGEGQGETWYSVKYFPDHDVYIRIDGFYASYDGITFDGWEDCREVRPQTKTITVYE